MQTDDEECPQRLSYTGAVDLYDSGPGRLKLDIFDDTDDDFDGANGPTLRRVAKPIDRVVNSWLHEWLGDSYASRLLAQMGMPAPLSVLREDFASIIGTLLYVWLIQMPLPWAVVQLVNEKQHRLRSMMRMHGLDNGAPPSGPRTVTCSSSPPGLPLSPTAAPPDARAAKPASLPCMQLATQPGASRSQPAPHACTVRVPDPPGA